MSNGKAEDGKPKKPRMRIGRLNSAGAILSEWGRLYRQLRRHEITEGHAKTCGYLLERGLLAVDGVLFEGRIADVEKALAEGRTPPALPASNVSHRPLLTVSGGNSGGNLPSEQLSEAENGGNLRPLIQAPAVLGSVSGSQA